MKIRVLVADDHALVRAGLVNLVGDFEGFEVVGDAADGREALALARRVSPDIVLLDVSMPGLNGIDACARLMQEAPGAKVVLLSMHASGEYVLPGLKAGARAYVIKDAAPEELEQALRLVARGGTYLSPQVTGHVVEQWRRGGAAEPAGPALTVRHREVLQLIAEGRSTREIAGRLHLSIKTVESHRAEIMRRLDIHDVAGLTRYAMRIGLVAPGN
ncbi:MAG: response regulator transcription factor [Burkholderiales bacterium]|nr:response regulator transcription factor [Burkholderiales bacterium]MCC7116248.1 response regulator transcription factor [Burkholderiales bacterium]